MAFVIKTQKKAYTKNSHIYILLQITLPSNSSKSNFLVCPKEVSNLNTSKNKKEK